MSVFRGACGFAACLLVAMLACCAALGSDGDAAHITAAEAAEPVTLHLWNIPPKGSTHVGAKADRAVFDLFLQRHPHIRVKALVPLHIEGPAAEGNEFLAVAGGVAPDVFFLFGRKVGDYIDQGFLQPLNERFARDFVARGQRYAGVWAPDRIWEICLRDEQIMAVPCSYYFMALQYRKDLFARAGLDPNRAPRDWDELWQTGRRLTVIPSKEADPDEAQVPVLGFGLNTGPFRGWHFLQFVWSGGGQVVRAYKTCDHCGKQTAVRSGVFDYEHHGIDLLNAKQFADELAAYRESCSDCGQTLAANSTLNWKLVTDEAGGVAAVDFYRRLASQKWVRCANKHPGREFDLTPEMLAQNRAVCPVCSETLDLRGAGSRRIYSGISGVGASESRGSKYEIAMRIMVLSDVTDLDTSQWSLTTFPVRSGSPARSFIAGSYLAINRTAPQRRQEAAWEYIKFVTGEEAQQVRVKAMVENGMAQYVRPNLLKTYGYVDYYRDLPAEWVRINEDVSRTAEVEPYCRGFTHVMTLKLGEVLDKAVLYPEASTQVLMRDICTEVNTRILGKRPESETRRYIVIAHSVIGLAAVLIACVMGYIIRQRLRGVTSSVTTNSTLAGVSKLRQTIYAWSFLAIALASVAVWQYYPLLRGSLMAFQDYKILSGGTFVGPQNFIDVVIDPNFYRFLLQTLLYVALSMSLGFFAPLLLAVMLSEVPRGSLIFRTIYYLPAMTTGLVTLFLWKQLIYDPAPEGALNMLLGWVGLPAQQYLGDPNLAMICVIIPLIWAGAGPGCLIYLAAFKCIPEEQYEAADLDGAGIFHKVAHVMFPNIKALMLINFLGAFVGAFQASENIFVMTGGGPVNATMTIGLDIWYHSFLYLNFGYATAQAWLLGAMLIGFTAIQLRVLGKVEFRAAGSAGHK